MRPDGQPVRQCLHRSLNIIGLVAAIAALVLIIYMLVRPYKEATKLSTKV